MFSQRLQEGKTGESLIAQWLKSRGHHVLPVYEIADNQYKGPAVYSSDGREIIAPDMLVFGNQSPIWVEAKHKNAFSWHRNTQRFVTGIDLHHYNEYRQIMEMSEWPVWLLFLQREGVAKDSKPGPSGLYGNSLDYLVENENHRHENWGKSGMVYWAIEHLQKISNYPLREAA